MPSGKGANGRAESSGCRAQFQDRRANLWSRPAQTSQHRRLAAVVHLAHIEARTMDMYAKRSFLKKLDEILTQKEELTEPVEAILGGNQ